MPSLRHPRPALDHAPIIESCVSRRDKIDLVLYATVQSSLIFSLLLGCAFALLARKPLYTLSLISLNILLHLLLDSLQTKWGNGVVLWAPPTNLAFFWPKQWPTYVLTVGGLAAFIIFAKKSLTSGIGLRWPGHSRGTVVALVTAVYIGAPLYFLKAAEKADARYANTVRVEHARVGKTVVFDRVAYRIEKDKRWISTYFGDFDITGLHLDEEAIVSIKGVFTERHKIRVDDHHVNDQLFRDGSSYLGLVLVLILWLASVAFEIGVTRKNTEHEPRY